MKKTTSILAAGIAIAAGAHQAAGAVEVERVKAALPTMEEAVAVVGLGQRMFERFRARRTAILTLWIDGSQVDHIVVATGYSVPNVIQTIKTSRPPSRTRGGRGDDQQARQAGAALSRAPSLPRFLFPMATIGHAGVRPFTFGLYSRPVLGGADCGSLATAPQCDPELDRGSSQCLTRSQLASRVGSGEVGDPSDGIRVPAYAAGHRSRGGRSGPEEDGWRREGPSDFIEVTRYDEKDSQDRYRSRSG